MSTCRICRFIAGVFVLAISACSPEPESDSYWALHTIDNSFEGADGVDAADVDADGDQDLVVGWEESGRAVLYQNPGHQDVRQSWQSTDISVGLDVRKIEDAKFADFDGDGGVDAVVTATENQGEKVNIHWLVDSKRPFSSDSWKGVTIDPTIRQAFMKVSIGQVDGVGANDIVVGSKADKAPITAPAKLLWYKSPDKPNYDNSDLWKGRPIADIYWINTIEIVDVDEDGDNDVLMSDWNVLAWFENPGSSSESDNFPFNWEKHLISDEADSSFVNCAEDQSDPSKLHLIVSAVDAKSRIDAGDTLFYSIRKEFSVEGQWTGGWIESKLSALEPLPSDVDKNDYDLKGVACGNIDNNSNVDLVVSASGYGHGVFALMNLQASGGDQAVHLKVISSDEHNTRKGIKHDNLLLNDMDGDGDLDIVTTEENGNTGSYFFPRGLGLIWYENPIGTDAVH